MPESSKSSASRRPVPLPNAVVSAAPGSELDAVLTTIDVQDVSGYDTVEVAKAWWRQASRVTAMFWLAVLETGLREPGSADTVARVAEPGDLASEEIRAALLWSRRRASSTFALAYDVHVRLPDIGAAMLAGRLDEHRAATLAKWTRDLSAAHAHQICASLLPRAESMTIGGLIDQIKRIAIGLDPEWARRRYESAVKERRVVGTQNASGTANVAGLDLPIDRAKAGCDRIDTLARSCKTAGDSRPIDHIRADLYLGMIDGSFENLSTDQIVAYVLTHPLTVEAEATGAGATNTGATDTRATKFGSSGGAPVHPDDTKDTPPSDFSHNDASEDDASEDDASEDDASDEGPGQGEPGSGGSAGGPNRPPRPAPFGGNPAANDTGNAPPGAATAWTVGELRLELTTALGRDEHPAEIPPWGYVPAGTARAMVGTMHGAEWRFVICDDQGRAICSGTTSSRPNMPDSAGRARVLHGHAGIVELQVRVTDLRSLDAACASGRYPDWADVVCDIAGRVEAGAIDTDAAAEHVRRRVPGASLRRLVEVRARYCTHPACHAPAATGDQDHITEHSRGGTTTASNLHPPCRHDHRLRHEGRWRVSASEDDGTVQWTSPLGHTYRAPPPQVMTDLPSACVVTSAA